MAALLFALGQAWLLAGLFVAVAFLLVGLDRVDPAARGAYAFRPLLLPGLVLLWPLVLIRWLAPWRDASLSRGHRRAHGRIWTALALLLPAILAAALLLRQHDLPRPASERLSPGASEAQP